MDMSFDKFIQWAFLGLVSGGVVYGMRFAAVISKSIGELNIKLATLLERTAGHSREIEEHTGRINRLEREVTRL